MMSNIIPLRSVRFDGLFWIYRGPDGEREYKTRAGATTKAIRSVRQFGGTVALFNEDNRLLWTFSKNNTGERWKDLNDVRKANCSVQEPYLYGGDAA